MARSIISFMTFSIVVEPFHDISIMIENVQHSKCLSRRTSPVNNRISFKTPLQFFFRSLGKYILNQLFPKAKKHTQIPTTQIHVEAKPTEILPYILLNLIFTRNFQSLIKNLKLLLQCNLFVKNYRQLIVKYLCCIHKTK